MFPLNRMPVSAGDPDGLVDEQVDALVIGARCAGAATAMLLARRGLRVLVLDKAAYGTDTLSTHALMRGGVQQLQRWGLLDDVVAAGTPAVTRTLFHYAQETVRVTIKPALGVSALYAPRRTVLDPILVDAARRAGAEVRYGITVTELLRAPDGTVVGVLGHDRQRQQVRIGAGLTIGADGRRSAVAGLVEAPIRTGPFGSACVYAYLPGIRAEGYEWYWRPGQFAGLIPTNDGDTLAFAGGSGPAVAGAGARPAERFGNLLRGGLADLGDRVGSAAARPGIRFHEFVGSRPQLRQAWGRGWALVGDAGSSEDPLTAHGITTALRDAELLSRAVVAAYQGEQPMATSLARYQAERNRLSSPVFQAAESLAAFSGDEDVVHSELLRLNSAMTEESETLARLDAVPPETAPSETAPSETAPSETDGEIRDPELV